MGTHTVLDTCSPDDHGNGNVSCICILIRTNMTLNTLAKLSGVSVATVSKAFSGSNEISEETRARIFDISREHDCFDKYNKNKFDKKVIAVICPELKSDYYNTFASILEKEITAQGGIMTVSVSSFSTEHQQELIAYYSAYCRVDGIILVDPQIPISNDFMIPAVAIGKKSDISSNICYVSLPLSNAIDQAVQYLYELGHRRIGFAGEELTTSKLTLFEESMAKLHIPLDCSLIYKSHERFERAGICAADYFCGMEEMPTAILAAYDHIAIGMIKEFTERGIRVPDDVSVIGMDDIAIAPYLTTSLSSISSHTDKACHTAVDMIMKKILNQNYTPQSNIVISSEFIPRGSSDIPRSKK